MAVSNHTIFDFINLRWGRDFNIWPDKEDERRGRFLGIATPLPETGDYAMLERFDKARGKHVRYYLRLVVEDDYCRDPRDMFKGDYFVVAQKDADKKVSIDWLEKKYLELNPPPLTLWQLISKWLKRGK